jgi:hypothetical protein
MWPQACLLASAVIGRHSRGTAIPFFLVFAVHTKTQRSDYQNHVFIAPQPSFRPRPGTAKEPCILDPSTEPPVQVCGQCLCVY